MSDDSKTEWTTRFRPEWTRDYGVEELHSVYLAPPGWPGKGIVVTLGIPECELVICIIDSADAPLAMINRPTANLNVRHWTRYACEEAQARHALMTFHCDTAAQAEIVARRAGRLLPDYRRIALERMYDPATRVAERLS